MTTATTDPNTLLTMPLGVAVSKTQIGALALLNQNVELQRILKRPPPKIAEPTGGISSGIVTIPEGGDMIVNNFSRVPTTQVQKMVLPRCCKMPNWYYRVDRMEYGCVACGKTITDRRLRDGPKFVENEFVENEQGETPVVDIRKRRIDL